MQVKCIDAGPGVNLTYAKLYVADDWDTDGTVRVLNDIGNFGWYAQDRFEVVPEPVKPLPQVRVLTLDIPLNAKQVVVTVSEAGASWQWDCAE